MVPAMPVVFGLVWIGVFVALGWVAWTRQREGLFLTAFAWLLFVGPACWLLYGAARS